MTGPRLRNRASDDTPPDPDAVDPAVRKHHAEVSGPPKTPRRRDPRTVADVTPEIYQPPPQATRETLGRPELPPNAPFLYMISPERWMVSGDVLIPELGTLPLVPGINNVRVVDEKIDPAPAIAKHRNKPQFQLTVPWDVDGKGTSYLRKQSRGPGQQPHWHSRFHAPETPPTPVQERAYREWALSLVDRVEGMSPPAAWVVSRLIERATEHRERVSAQGSPDREQRLARVDRDLVVLHRELAAAEARESAAYDPDAYDPDADALAWSSE